MGYSLIGIMCLGLCKGKKLHDKRDSAAERETKRDIDRAMKERNYR